MLNYEEVEKIARQVERAYDKLDHINAEEANLMDLPKVEYDIPDIITGWGGHNDVMCDLYKQHSINKRLEVLGRQRDECNELFTKLVDLMHSNLIPNHWYVFDKIAVMNVVWLNHARWVSWRIDIERIENKEKYIEFNAHNMKPLTASSADFQPMDPYDWFVKRSKKEG